MRVGSGKSGLISGTGLLSLSNTQFTVSGDVVVGSPYDKAGELGLVKTAIHGIPSGLDIGGSLTVTNGARIEIEFLGPQTEFSGGGSYWGLRIAGDRTVQLAALHDSERLTWIVHGFSEKEQSRFGIHYWPGGDYTYVGVLPPYGARIMLD
jgi:hypothetical protein